MSKKSQEIYAYRERGFGDSSEYARCVIHQLEHPTQEARFAMCMIERWAMVQCQSGGEDSAGRHKLELMPVDDVVERGIEIAELAFQRFRTLKWLDPVPTLAELSEEIKERENKQENGN
jgi:hypothetical protein